MTTNPLVVDNQDAKWIHRDKLTQIEIQEYIDRGMNPPAELLNRVGQRREYLRSKQARSPDKNDIIDIERQRIKSPELSPDSPDDEDEPFVPADPRTPAEIARDPYEGGGSHNMPKLRASSSKIPLATASPLPIPIEHIERDTPLRRKREISNDWDNEHTSPFGIRSRSESIGSQILLDDDLLNGSMSPQRSLSKSQDQPKVRVPPNSTKIANGKQRTSSGTMRAVSGNARPGTRNGTGDRPRTAANRPEGDPPWMDQIYQPDPMLPPDQQMLPTHAKRIRAEQWEKEGKTGMIYDRELSPVQVYNKGEASPPIGKNKAPNEPQSLPQASNNPPWPLKSIDTSELPKSPNPEHAGYSTMPKVQTTPIIGALPSPRLQSKPEQQLQLEPEKEESQKRNCGCCVVM